MLKSNCLAKIYYGICLGLQDWGVGENKKTSIRFLESGFVFRRMCDLKHAIHLERLTFSYLNMLPIIATEN